ncbi:hypothetical protein AUC68_11205 [Methyloceanibacter methanicus]|uniref:Uncharacterized protein n=1 Tax=Methyloceanibacter methanicus TaxID=1774968 RepID=A0A1E3VX14_9HYPH|nr:hypothetical protein [Methyloceanibacter methanicus]ODR98059.1 hypothetical protein AUC68_11205 [Methyloceanibacter methanicus]
MTNDPNITEARLETARDAMSDLDDAVAALDDAWFGTGLADRIDGTAGTGAVSYLLRRVVAETEKLHIALYPNETKRAA